MYIFRVASIFYMKKRQRYQLPVSGEEEKEISMKVSFTQQTFIQYQCASQN